MTAVRWQSAPQFYSVGTREFPSLTGKTLWAVLMNNAVEVACSESLIEAQQIAARRNYAENCYRCPQQFGLDGI